MKVPVKVWRASILGNRESHEKCSSSPCSPAKRQTFLWKSTIGTQQEREMFKHSCVNAAGLGQAEVELPGDSQVGGAPTALLCPAFLFRLCSRPSFKWHDLKNPTPDGSSHSSTWFLGRAALLESCFWTCPVAQSCCVRMSFYLPGSFYL